jgi:phage portal protein BeeE
MAFWNSWRAKPKSKYETKSVALGLSDSLGKFLMFGAGSTATTPQSALNLYQQSTAVSIPIGKITNPFKVMTLALQVGSDVVREHPVLELLKKPSPFHSQELFLEILMKDYLITGEYFIVGVGNVNRPPLQLIPISPANLTPVRREADVASIWNIAGSTLPGTYEATPNVKAPVVRYLQGGLLELKHVRNYSPKDNSLLRGQSLLVSAAREARQHVLGTQHNISLLENGGRISLVFHFEEDMDDEDFEATRDRVLQRFGGAQRAGQIGVTAGGKLQVEELGTNPKDMDFANLQMIASKSMSLQYDVPLPLVTDARQTQNNYQTAVLALFDDAVLPNSKCVLGGLSDLLLPRYGMDPRKAQIIADQDSVTALVMRRNEELKVRSMIGVETDNEIRAHMGREPYEGGDLHYKNASMVPVGTDLWTADNDPDKLEPALGGADEE